MIKMLSFSFAWYDLWVGLYVDWEKRTLYCCPLPCCLIKIGPFKGGADKRPNRYWAALELARRMLPEFHPARDIVESACEAHGIDPKEFDETK